MPYLRKVKYSESASCLHLQVPKPDLRYLDQFIRLKCAPELLALGIYPNAKEITESYAAFAAVKKLVGPARLGDPSILLVEVGSGVAPRTAGLFAFLSKWSCLSIDPNLKETACPSIPLERFNPGIQRWRGRKQRIEEVGGIKGRTIVLVAVHSHAPLDIAWEKCEAPQKYCVALPCCVKQEIPGVSLLWEKEDWGIHSEHRIVKAWSSHEK